MFDFARRHVVMLTWALVLSISAVSCTKAVRMPQKSYAELDSKDGLSYRISTIDDRVYETDDFRVTDSTLVIASTIVQGKRIQIEPVTLGLDEIATIDRIDNSSTFYVVLFAGATVVVLYASAISVIGQIEMN